MKGKEKMTKKELRPQTKIVTEIIDGAEYIKEIWPNGEYYTLRRKEKDNTPRRKLFGKAKTIQQIVEEEKALKKSEEVINNV